jgi:hypothetical protein
MTSKQLEKAQMDRFEMHTESLKDKIINHHAASCSDSVNHPSHYNDGKIEVIEYIEDKNLGFHLGNAVKYISRAGKKDPSKTLEDLKKAMWYIQRHMEVVSGGTRRPNEMPLTTGSISSINTGAYTAR